MAQLFPHALSAGSGAASPPSAQFVRLVEEMRALTEEEQVAIFDAVMWGLPDQQIAA